MDELDIWNILQNYLHYIWQITEGSLEKTYGMDYIDLLNKITEKVSLTHSLFDNLKARDASTSINEKIKTHMKI